jgi:uncharacterized membrane protein YtjA (UPF0391 family)
VTSPWLGAALALFQYEVNNMLRAAIIFFVIAVIAAFFGMGNVAGVSADAARILLYVFLALAVISLLGGLITGRRHGPPLP